MSEPAAGSKRNKRWQFSRPFKIVMAVLIAPLLLYAISQMVFGVIEYFAKRDIDRAYSRISLPSEFRQTRKVWQSGGLDTTAHWTYEYQIDASRQTALALVDEAARKAGYSLNDTEVGIGSLVLENEQDDIRLRTSSYSLASAPRNAKAEERTQLPPQKVIIEAEEI